LKKAEEKGREEEKLVIAKNLLSQNIDIQAISSATSLSVSDIEKLKS
jgi:predicted transposase/invertase (TIGR01784 family)